MYTKSTRGHADSNRQGFRQVGKTGLNILVVKNRQRIWNGGEDTDNQAKKKIHARERFINLG